MHKLLPNLIVICLLALSCSGHQPTNIPAPDPVVETFSFDRPFLEMAMDQSGNPWLRTAAHRVNLDPISSYIPEVNTICRFAGDSFDQVYTDLPGLGSMAFEGKDRPWAITARSLVTISQGGIDKVYTGMGLINTLLVDIHDNIWITPAETGIVKIDESGQQLFTREHSGILSSTVSSSSVDQSNTKWFGHITSGISRMWIVISHIEQMATLKMDLYYHDLDWHKHELLPGEEIIVSLQADRRHGILYVLTTHSLYRIR